MKTLYIITLILLSATLFAQDKNAADSLVKQGIKLGHDGKYAEAISKFADALKLDPANLEAEYETGYNLYVSGNAKDAIPHLEKVIKGNPSDGASYDLLGTIYDDDKQPAKAIKIYQEGIKASPNYEHLQYNLGIAYFGQKKYADAELCGLDAVNLDPKHASAHRLYATAAFNQNKRICAILGFCNFLLIEPKTNRSAAVFKSLQQVMQYGVSRTDDKNISLSFNPNQGEFSAVDLMISLSAATALEKNKNLSPYEQFAAQLNTIISITGEQSGDKKGLFWKYYAAYFYALSKSDNMQAFTRLVTQSAFKDENEKWFRDNPDKLAALNKWIADTSRN